MDKEKIIAGLLKGNRRCIAKAITLIESNNIDHHQSAEDILQQIMPQTGQAIRIGITGIPGVGKSTFIENFGLHLIKAGHKVAVLAIDPSSPISGGSILGDKTRMEQLSAHESAFIRPSPSKNFLGGIARHTKETSLLLEAAGYDIILIETVGVGQSETIVSSMVDVFVVLQMPKTGDELQGIKKGILELADFILINKADHELLLPAQNSKKQIEHAFSFLGSRQKPHVLLTSQSNPHCYEDVWGRILNFVEVSKESNLFKDKRSKQQKEWFYNELNNSFFEYLKRNPLFEVEIEKILKEVESNRIPPSVGARQLFKMFLKT